MAECKTLEKSPITPVTPLLSGSSSSSPPTTFDDDDLYQDSCSICLEPFSLHHPANVTNCNHEYHLHCILEWFQRSKECPLCSQSLDLKDPASQDLFAAVEIECNARGSTAPTNSHLPDEFHLEYGSYWTDDLDFNERHLASTMSRARQAHRNETRRSSDGSSSSALMFQAPLSVSGLHTNTLDECSSAGGSSGGNSPPPSISSLDVQSPLSRSPSVLSLPSGPPPSIAIHQPLSLLETPSTDCTHKPRPSPSELLAFSDSIKSKFSAASARYKDSISKGTQGFRDKLLARNITVKEMGKGVHREMSASIAGVSRMIEKLDLKSKRNSDSPEGVSRVWETRNLFSKGKGVLDHIIASSRENRVQADPTVDMHEKSQSTNSSGR